jgi:hypothetical protein
MSIVGTKGRGSYRATLERRNGVWVIVSSRLDLSHGRSIDIELEDLKETVGVPIRAGSQLKDDAINQEQWSDIKWDQQHLRLLMPPVWIEETRDETHLEFKMDGLNAFARIQVPQLIELDSGVTHRTSGANLLADNLGLAAELLRNGEIAGYDLREVGGVPGVLMIFDKGDNPQVSWEGFPLGATDGRSLMIRFGARENDFARLETTFNAILDSVQFDWGQPSASMRIKGSALTLWSTDRVRFHERGGRTEGFHF